MRFKNVLKAEAKGATIYMFATFLTQFGSFLIVPFFWKHLSVRDYGVIAIIDIIGSFLGMFLGLQLDISITRFYYEWQENDRKRQVGNLWIFSWIATLVLGALCILAFSRFSDFLFRDVAFYPYIFLGLISIVMNRFSVVPFATIRIVNKPFLYAWYSVVSFVIQMSLNVYYVVFLDQKLYGLFVSNIIGCIVTAILGSIIMLRYATPYLHIRSLREPLRFAIPQIPASTISGITSFLDRFLLQRYASLEILGVYSLCLKFTNIILNLHNALKISFIPFMVKAVAKDREEGIGMITKMRLYYIFPLLLIALGISLYIKDFVFWINRPDYFPIVTWVPWLVIPALMSTFTVYFAPGLFLAKRSNLNWIPAIVQLAIVLVFGLVFIPRMKMAGVIISRYTSVVSLFLTTLILSERVYPIPIRWKKLGLMIALLILITVFSIFVHVSLLTSITLNTGLLLVYGLACTIIITGSTRLNDLFKLFRKDDSEV